MGKNSSIAWTNHTFNPWIGCSKVSPGCLNCYAERQNKHRKWCSGHWGTDRRRTSDSNWKNPILWDREAAKTGERTLVFCASLADVFDKSVPESWRDDLFSLINNTPHLTWLLLTKRENDMHLGGYPKNVWLGVTAENQEMWDRRVPLLLSSGAKMKFVSVEPMLGPIDMRGHYPDWVIVGGESGGKEARVMRYEWVEYLYVECQYHKVPFFFKQIGTNGIWPTPSNISTIREYPEPKGEK